MYSSTHFNLFFSHDLQEKDARDIEIPNIRWEVFHLMMRFNASYNLLFEQTVLREPFQFTGGFLSSDSYTLDL